MNTSIIERIDELNRTSADVRKGDLAQRLKFADEAIDLATKEGYIEGLARAHHSRASLLRLQKRPDTAIEDLQTAMGYFEQVSDLLGISNTHRELGFVYLDLAMYQVALKHLFNSRRSAELAGNAVAFAGSHMNLGNLYSRLDQHEKARELYRQSLTLHAAIPHVRGVARAKGNLGLSHLLTGDTVLALAYMEEVLPVLEAEQLYVDQCLALCTIGEIHYTDGRLDQAVEYLDRSHELANEHAFKRGLVSIYFHLARVAQLRKQCGESLQFFEKGLKLATEFSASGMKLKYLASISKLHEQCGDYAKALQVQREYSDYNETLQREQFNTALEVRETAIRNEQEELERRWLEAKNVELENANLELERLNDHKDEILRIVSHDMRTPLSTIIGMGNLMRTEGLSSSEEGREYGSIIEESGNRLLHFINDLLDLSKSESGGFRLEAVKTNLIELLGKTVHIFEPLAERKAISLTLNHELDLPDVVIDGPKIGQVMGNVISNALKFTPQGGFVRIAVGLSSETHVRIIVSDTGVGIPNEMLPKVFEKFGLHQRPGTDGERGTGLGMPIVKRFVELHGGTVMVQSEVGKGTIITVNLPLESTVNQSVFERSRSAQPFQY